ncbi:MAG: alpha/beta hydrolase [Ferruginibacter sp.]
MNIQKLLIPVACTLLFISSCSKDEVLSPGTSNTMQNVSYGSDAAQKMDIYLPAGRTTATTKVIIMIHGGGWTGGDKTDFTTSVDTLKKRLPDYAIFNINYRLSANPFNLFPIQELDVKAAVDYIYSKATEYQVSNKYVLMGASAGAHLAMLQAYKYNVPVKAKAVVSFFGPGDLADMYNDPVGGNPLFSLALANAIGATPAQNPAIYTNSSPVNFINSNSAMPTILLHGGMDPLVNPSQSVAVQNKLIAAGIINQYVLYPTGGHGDWDAATYTDAFNKIQLFLEANVQ